MIVATRSEPGTVKGHRNECIDMIELRQCGHEPRAEVVAPCELVMVFETTDRFGHPSHIWIRRSSTLDEWVQLRA